MKKTANIIKTKRQQIIDLFLPVFRTDSFLEQKPAQDFLCPHMKECMVNKETPSWTPFLGSEDMKFMIIAEAPSKMGGQCPNIGGLTEMLPKEKKKGEHFILY